MTNLKALCGFPRRLKVFLQILLIFSSIFISNAGKAFELDPSDLRGKRTIKPVSVLQSRYFLKALRPEIGLLFGKFVDEAYVNTASRGARLGLFFNEWVGLELQYVDTSTTSTDDRKALRSIKYKRANPPPGEEDTLVSPDPEINPIYNFIDANFVAAPFYGKLNVLDWTIIYSDLYLSLGASKIATEQGDKTSLVFGVGQRFYLFKAWSIRIDFRDHYFTETRADQLTNRNAVCVDFGVSYFFL